MSNVIAKITLSTPDDSGSDKVRLYSCATESGSYTLASTLDYSYGQEVVTGATIDTTKYYKIAFYNSTTSVEGNLSDARLGSTWQNAKPLFNLSSFYDSNPLALPADVYSRTPHNASDVPEATVQVFLTSARAKVNLITADQELDKYTNLYDTDVANRKYNASLQVMKDAEIYFALGLMYRYLGDAQAEKVINDTTDNSSESISIGLTSISTASGDKRNASTKLFDDRAKSYDALAMSILSAILPNGIPVSYSDETIGGSKFLSPTTGRRM